MSHVVSEQPSQKDFFMHTHAQAELYCFLGGDATFHVEGTAYPLLPGDVLVMRPAEAHYVQVAPDKPYERILLNFDTGILSAIDPEDRLMQLFFQRTAGTRNLYRLKDDNCLACLQKMTAPCQEQRLAIMGNLILLLQQLTEIFCSEQHIIDNPDTLESRIIRYINKNLDRELTIQALCDRFFISRTQLCQRFRQATGTSIGNYITAKRLILARRLLRHNQKPTEVFTACGYQDYSAFYRAYQNYFGHSPRDEQQFDYLLTPDEHLSFG